MLDLLHVARLDYLAGIRSSAPTPIQGNERSVPLRYIPILSEVAAFRRRKSERSGDNEQPVPSFDRR
jgi:hypothetical protein